MGYASVVQHFLINGTGKKENQSMISRLTKKHHYFTQWSRQKKEEE